MRKKEVSGKKRNRKSKKRPEKIMPRKQFG